MLDLSRHEVERSEALLDLLGRGAPAQVDETELGLNLTLPVDREVLGHDVLALPVVLAGGDHAGERQPVVDRDRETVVLEKCIRVPEERLKVPVRDLTLGDKSEKMLHLAERRGCHGYSFDTLVVR